MKNTEPDLIATLLRSAGPRTAPDAERFERARQNVQAEWRATIARRRNTRQIGLAAAATVVLAIAAVLTKVFWQSPVPVIATVNRISGDVLVRHAQGGHLQVNPLQAGQTLVADFEIDTGATGRVLLTWTNGEQLRLDQHSLVELKSTQELHLTRGAVYIETSGAPGLAITTPFGIARHIGTQFEVRVTDGQTRVRVREGSVSFSSRHRAPVTIVAGQQLSASDEAMKLEAGPGSADEGWQWLYQIAPPFAIEGRSLFDALEWLSHESGMRIVYRSNGARAQARAVILRGSIEGLEMHKAFIAVLAGSGLMFDVHADRVEIRATDLL